MIRIAVIVSILVVGGLAWGCRPAQIGIEITEPANGANLSGRTVHLVLAARGVEIAPVAEQRAGAAHHHLFVDQALTPLAEPVPAGVRGIIHLGGGQTEFDVENLAPGPHRVIAVLADNTHLPLQPPAVDTVEFTIRE